MGQDGLDTADITPATQLRLFCFLMLEMNTRELFSLLYDVLVNS